MKPEKNTITALADLTGQFAFQLAFAEAGKDTGLLPLNNYLMQIEEALPAASAPAPLPAAVAAARRWLDQVLDTTGRFDSVILARLGAWPAWMQTACARWTEGQPLPELPPEWNLPAAAPIAVGLDFPPPTPVPNLLPEAPGAEPSLRLNVESDFGLLREFLHESLEHLQNIENGILVLEENPGDADTLHAIFRAFHTFKGGSGFLNLTPIQNLAHELESLLDAARHGQLAINPAIIDLILQGADTLKAFTTQIAAQLDGPDAGRPIVVPTLQTIARVKAVLANPGAAVPRVVAAGVEHGGTSVFSSKALPVSTPGPDGRMPPSTAGGTPTTTAAGLVKVDTAKLDSLVDLVGEFVIAESMVVQDPELLALPGHRLARNLAQLRRITGELQRTAMSLRMVPIKATFQKMTRLVRDLAVAQHKQVQLVFHGEDTELDRNLVGELADPLIHMIRNSADHGIEPPEVRVARGKPALGTIWLRAFHQGGNVVLQIQDDGAGLNKERILARAAEQGLVKPGAPLADQDIFALIFAAGFSTAEKVTDLSGRGVGMDVVRRNIEKLRGKIKIESVAGQGTTFSIFLPLTLAIIDGLIVGVSGERYIIPTLAVRESFRPSAGMISTVHERGEMVNVRGRLSPLLRLNRYFGQPPTVTDPARSIVVVVESGAQTRCLMVDELLGKQEVVIKSLGEALKNNRALAGGAVLGDGRVGLILDVDTLVRLEGPTALAA